MWPKNKRDRYNQYRHSIGVAHNGPLEVIGEVNDVLIYMFMTPLGQNAKYSSFCTLDSNVNVRCSCACRVLNTNYDNDNVRWGWVLVCSRALVSFFLDAAQREDRHAGSLSRRGACVVL